MGWFAALLPANSHSSRQRPSLQLPSAGPSSVLSTRWQRQREDEELYGAASPRINNNVLFSASSSGANSPASASLPPLHVRQGPFFHEALTAPIGMGAGQLIIDPRAPGTPPSVKRSWDRVRRALASLPELVDTLAPAVDPIVLASLETTLAQRDLRLPQCVKDYFAIHDGQDSFSAPAETVFGGSHGLFWGLWAMSVEQVEAEWGFWRRLDGGAVPRDAFSTSSFVNPRLAGRDIGDERGLTSPRGDRNDEESQPGMSSCPAGWVRQVYSHHGWIPLATDRAGNYIGLDLCPPTDPRGWQSPSPSSPSPRSRPLVGGGQGHSRPSSGQVIAFGREIDEKVVLWRGDGDQGWAKWLASFVDDLETGAFAKLKGLKSSYPYHVRKISVGQKHKYRDDQDSSESDDQEGHEDGLGDVGYFNDGSAHGYGNGDRKMRKWQLSKEYRGMHMIQAICERSRRRWREVGLRSSRDADPESTDVATEVQEQSLHSPGREDPPCLGGSPFLNHNMSTSNGYADHGEDAASQVDQPSLALDPLSERACASSSTPKEKQTTMAAFVTPPSPQQSFSASTKKSAQHDPTCTDLAPPPSSTNPSTSKGKNKANPHQHHQYLPSHHHHRSGNTRNVVSARQTPPPPPPPPPAPVGLPTLADLMNGTTSYDRTPDLSSSSTLSSHHHHQANNLEPYAPYHFTGPSPPSSPMSLLGHAHATSPTPTPTSPFEKSPQFQQQEAKREGQHTQSPSPSPPPLRLETSGGTSVGVEPGLTTSTSTAILESSDEHGGFEDHGHGKRDVSDGTPTINGVGLSLS